MKKSYDTKPWRLNVLITYYEQSDVNSFRVDILQMLQHLASIYKLDYAISEEHQFPALTDLIKQANHINTVDLVYFRSHQLSRVEAKDFRLTIRSMFGKVPSQFREGVEIFDQDHKSLPEFPFPVDFYRPLGYPHIEFYKGSQKKLYTFAEPVMEALEKEQDFPLN